MDDIPGTDCQRDFVSESGAFEFVRVPTRREWSRLVDFEVCAIDRYHTVSVILCPIRLPIAPFDLCDNKETIDWVR